MACRPVFVLSSVMLAAFANAAQAANAPLRAIANWPKK